MIEPPHDVFFRACRKVTLPLYQLIVLTNARDLQEAMLIIRHMLKAILKLRVSMLALSDRNLLRIHCFDRDTEYRRMELDDGDRIIEAVLRAEEETAMDPDLIYEDEMLLREEFIEGAGGLRALKVINRFRYTYFDTMTLDNYRLSYQE